jgi:hypothetical protein
LPLGILLILQIVSEKLINILFKMTEKDKTEKWIPDISTYNELQKLKKFADFVARLDRVNDNTQKVKEIHYHIENIDKPETYKIWNVCFNIIDYEALGNKNVGGIFRRHWSVYFENDYIDITAETRHTEDEIYHYGNDFFFYGTVYFEKNIECQRIYMDKNIDEFIADAMNYKKYITETLNEIEIDIEVN